jgi:hypothetical protein
MPFGTTLSAKRKSAPPATTARTRIEAEVRNREMPCARSAVDSDDLTRPETAMRAAAAKDSGTTSTRIGASLAWKYPRIAAVGGLTRAMWLEISRYSMRT